MKNKQNVEGLKSTDIEVLMNFSVMMEKLSKEGKFELMENINSFLKTGDKNLLLK